MIRTDVLANIPQVVGQDVPLQLGHENEQFREALNTHANPNWLVTGTTYLTKLHDDGHLSVINHNAIKPGDFVDVLVYPDVTTIYRGGSSQPRLKVRFGMDEVTLLKTGVPVTTVSTLMLHICPDISNDYISAGYYSVRCC